MPDTPRALIPLLLAGISGFLAALFLAFTVFRSNINRYYQSWSSTKFWRRHPPVPETDGDSITTLVNPVPAETQRSTRNPLVALLCFAIPALLLEVTAAALEMVDMAGVRKAWNVKEGTDLGLTLKRGSLAYSE